MATAAARPATRGWVRNLSWLAFILCLGAVAAALIASVGSGQGAWHFRVGFTVLRYAFYAAAGGAVLALIMLIASRRTAKFLLINLVALIVAVSSAVTAMPNRRRSSSWDGCASHPVTAAPRRANSSARALIPAPAMPTKWTGRGSATERRGMGLAGAI